MNDLTRDEEIEEVLDDFLGPRPKNALGTSILEAASPRLDVSKPNFHDTKAEFLVEKNAVTAIISHLQGVVDAIKPVNGGDDMRLCRDRLRTVVDAKALRSLRHKTMEGAADLAFQNVVLTGFFYNSIYIVIEMIDNFEHRLQELTDQEAQFWSVSHRPPNYYARTIALRLARLYAKEKGVRPTFGISSEGNHPSTDYGRALERIFSILGVNAAVKSAAQWALSQLTDDDFRKPLNALAAYASAIPPANPATRGIVEALLARSAKAPQE